MYSVVHHVTSGWQSENAVDIPKYRYVIKMEMVKYDKMLNQNEYCAWERTENLFSTELKYKYWDTPRQYAEQHYPEWQYAERH